MAIPLNDNIHISAGKPADDKYLQLDLTPYPTTAAVLSRIPMSERHRGQTFLVLTEEYWFQSDLTTLAAKGSGGGLGYTAEDQANKTNTFSTLDDILYPTVLATNNRIIELAWNLVGLNNILGDVTIDSVNTFSIDFVDTVLFSVKGQDIDLITGATENRFVRLGETTFFGSPGVWIQGAIGESISIYAEEGASGLEMSNDYFSLFNSGSSGLQYTSANLVIDVLTQHLLTINFDQASWALTLDDVTQSVPLFIDIASSTLSTGPLYTMLTLRHTDTSVSFPPTGYGVAIDFEKETSPGGSVGLFGRLSIEQEGTSLGAKQYFKVYLDGFGGGSPEVLLKVGEDSTSLYPEETNPIVFLEDANMRAAAYAFYGSATPLDFLGTTTIALIYHDTVEDDLVAYIDDVYVTLTKIKYKPVTGTTYTILESDRGQLLGCENVGGCTVTVPVGLSIGHAVNIFRRNAAGPVVLASAGTLEGPGTTLNTAKTGASVVHIGSNIHIAQGALS